jgi:hypothetical protein
MRFDVYSLNQGKLKRWEAAFIFCACAVFILLVRDLLFSGKRTFDHDTVWYYGMIHYFFNSMAHGIFPYWDIYDYSGQAFYYNLGIARIMEIPTIILLYLNRLLNISFLTLYHWDFILKLVTLSTGVYLCFRQTNKFTLSNFVVFLSFLFSSFTFATMIQCGLLTSFCWIPWVFWFFLRLRKDFSFYNMVGFSLFLGLSTTSYQVGYVLTYLSVFLLTLLINDRAWFRILLRSKKNLWIALAGLAIVFALSLQVLAIYTEKENSVPVLRQLDSGLGNESYADKAGGSPSYPNDFLGLVFPPLAIKGWRGLEVGLNSVMTTGQWLKPMSECPFYVGIVPLFLALLGLFYSREKHRMNFAVMLFLTALLALNLKFRIGLLGDILFPFLKYARNMEMFQAFFIFSLAYFVGQGADIALRWGKRHAE